MFTSSIISLILTILVIYLFCKHKHIRTLVASLILHKIKEVEANPSSEETNSQCTPLAPWSTRLCPHSTIIKKMKTFLEVEGKMGPVPQPTSSQYRPPQPGRNPNVRKDNAVEKRKRAVATKRLRPSTVPKPSETAHLQLFPKLQSMSNPK